MWVFSNEQISLSCVGSGDPQKHSRQQWFRRVNNHSVDCRRDRKFDVNQVVNVREKLRSGLTGVDVLDSDSAEIPARRWTGVVVPQLNLEHIPQTFRQPAWTQESQWAGGYPLNGTRRTFQCKSGPRRKKPDSQTSLVQPSLSIVQVKSRFAQDIDLCLRNLWFCRLTKQEFCRTGYSGSEMSYVWKHGCPISKESFVRRVWWSVKRVWPCIGTVMVIWGRCGSPARRPPRLWYDCVPSSQHTRSEFLRTSQDQHTSRYPNCIFIW